MPNRNNTIKNCSYGPRGAGAEIEYAIADCVLGRLMVAGTKRGICFAAMGDSDDALVAELRVDYPLATIHHGSVNGSGGSHENPIVRESLSTLARYVAGQSAMPDPPLDIRGTPFQSLVWLQLRAIPIGETRSYTEIARRIGRPRAIRAVGTANGANPVSIIIPCHRALRASGHLGGYRWGLERKRLLLEMEANRR